jgi:hypothetical protein
MKIKIDIPMLFIAGLTLGLAAGLGLGLGLEAFNYLMEVYR